MVDTAQSSQEGGAEMPCHVRAPTGRTFLLCLLIAIAGCSAGRPLLPLLGRTSRSERISADELEGYLATYSSVFQGTVTVAADSIHAHTRDPDIRRLTLLWKLRICPLAYQTALLPDPLQSYVLLFTLATAQENYFSTGDGAQLFGKDQEVAINASQELKQSIEQIGARFLSDEELKHVTEQVEAFSLEYPMRGEFVVDTVQNYADATKVGGRFNLLVGISLSPFKALQGVDSGAQAIREFNQTALRFTQIIAFLPTFTRWNLELLAFDLETHHTVESGLAALESMAQGVQQFSTAASSLPSDLGREASQLVAQVDASQGEMKQTLEAARAALGEASDTAKSFEPVAAALDRTAEQLRQAGVAWTEMVSAVRGPADDAGKGKGDRPFDIQDYARTAVEINQAAAQLRGLVAETQAASGDVSRRIVDHLAWRAFELVLAFFAVLFVYRRIEAWFSARGPS
jgi:hypothetical protein